MKDTKDTIYSFEPLWGQWKVEELIGEGNFGKVYKVFREEWGQKYVSAVKLISIPQSSNDFKEAQSIGIDEGSMHGYFQDFVKNIVNEIEVMYKLKGNSNIVSYEDHLIKEKEDSVGWHILIKMEYVQSLTEYASQHDVSEQQVIKLGIDICKALETCEKVKIIHRDIKDANIFVSKNGDFKLGDFGIAKELSKSGRAASMRGTPLYMAPEVYKGENYDLTVDTYSLGIVMYKLLNKGRLPFMPPYPQPMTYRHTEASMESRIRGEKPGMPISSSKELGEIVLKACSYLPKDRYQSPRAMRASLEKILADTADNSMEVIAGETAEEIDEYKEEIPEEALEQTYNEETTEEVHTDVFVDGIRNEESNEVYKEEYKEALNKAQADDNNERNSPFNGTISVFNEKEGLEQSNQQNGTISIFNSDKEKIIRSNLNKTISIFKDNIEGKSANEEHKLEKEKEELRKERENTEKDVKASKPSRDKKKYAIYGSIAAVLIIALIIFAVINSKNNDNSIGALADNTPTEAPAADLITAQGYIDNAKQFYSEGKFEEALTELSKELEQNPDSEEAKSLEQQYKRDYSNSLTEEGEAQLKENKLEDAEASFEAALSIDAENTIAADRLNEVKAIMTQAEKSEDDDKTDKTSKKEEKTTNYAEEARTYFKKGSYKNAVNSLKKAIQKDSSNSSLVSKWGKELINSKNYTGAISYLTEAKNAGFKVNDLLGETYYNYAMSFYNNGDYKNAMEYLNQAKGFGVNISTALANAQYGYAKDLYNKGNYSSALDNFFKAKSLGATIELTYVRGYLLEINSQLESLKKDLVDFESNYSTKEEINGKDGLKKLLNTHISRLDNLKSRRNNIFSLNGSIASDSKGKSCDALINYCSGTINKLKEKVYN